MNGKCSQCGNNGMVVSHHTSYDPEKFIIVCQKCHRKLHKQFPDLTPPGYYSMRIAFEVTEKQEEQLKQLPRTVNISEEMRKCLDKFLEKKKVIKMTKNYTACGTEMV